MNCKSRKSRYQELFTIVESLMGDGSMTARYIGFTEDGKRFYATPERVSCDRQNYGPIRVSEASGEVDFYDEVSAEFLGILCFFDAEPGDGYTYGAP